MKIEVDITKPPKEEAARIERLLTELDIEKQKAETQKAWSEAFGIFKKKHSIEEILDYQRQIRDEWE